MDTDEDLAAAGPAVFGFALLPEEEPEKELPHTFALLSCSEVELALAGFVFAVLTGAAEELTLPTLHVVAAGITVFASALMVAEDNVAGLAFGAFKELAD